MKPLTIDGSMGEGGGQVLRSALALSVMTQRPFTLHRIRAGRRKPGLMRQHRTALQAAAAISRAQVRGGELGSPELSFSPKRVQSGEYHFAVGTAGSACLVLQTVLPPLLTAPGPSRLVLEGGTHNPWAPPFDFLQKTFLPLLAQMGAQVTATLERHGFYPAGGGRFVVEIVPATQLQPLELLERGPLLHKGGTVVSSSVPDHVPRREVKTLAHRLGWPESVFSVQEVHDSPGPGNVVFVELQYQALTEVLTGFGEKGVPVKKVLDPLVKDVRSYLASDAPVGPFLADQLLLPLALAGGGAFRTVGLSRHATTNMAVIEMFLDLTLGSETQKRGDVLVQVQPRR